MKEKRRKIPSVQFTPQERLALQLPMGKEPIKGHDAAALRKIIDTFPWMLDVAQCNFDSAVAHTFALAEGRHIEAEALKAKAIKHYIEKREKPNAQKA